MEKPLVTPQKAVDDEHDRVGQADDPYAHDEDMSKSTSYFDREVNELSDIKANGRIMESGKPYRFKSVSVYSGQWKNGMRHGNGCQQWPDGAKYEGQWKDNCAVGMGRFTHHDGDVYTGQWNNNSASGMGTYAHRGHTSYVGQWKMTSRTDMV